MEGMQKAVAMLADKARALGRLPKKSDFSSSEVCFIKAHLGAWNRALEQAGLKENSPLHQAKQQRVAAKRQAKKAAKKSEKTAENSEEL